MGRGGAEPVGRVGATTSAKGRAVVRGEARGRTTSRSYAKPCGHAPAPVALPFQCAAMEGGTDDDGSSVDGGFGSEDGVGVGIGRNGVGGLGIADGGAPPMRLMKVVAPCSGQKPGRTSTMLGDERRGPAVIRTPLLRHSGARPAPRSRIARRTALWMMKRGGPAMLRWASVASTLLVMASTIAFMDGVEGDRAMVKNLLW